MRLLFNIKNRENIEIQLKDRNRVVNKTHLTISQGFDILLISVLDNILSKNKIERLSLKSMEISGKVEPGALFGMVIQSIAKALIA